MSLSKEQLTQGIDHLMETDPKMVDVFIENMPIYLKLINDIYMPYGETNEIYSLLLKESGFIDGTEQPFHPLTTHHMEFFLLHWGLSACYSLKWMNIFILKNKDESFFKDIDINALKNAAIVCGLTHDSGKILARKFRNGTHGFKGHSQLGTALLTVLLKDYKYSQEILWAINLHMTIVTHMKSLDNPNTLLKIAAEIMYSLPEECNPNISFLLLAALSYGDQLGRIVEDKSKQDLVKVEEHSNMLFEQLVNAYKTDKISLHKYSNLPTTKTTIVSFYGPPCSGKSYKAACLIKNFQEKYGDNVTIIHLERDTALYQVYREHVGPTEGIEYKQIHDMVYVEQKEKLGGKAVDEMFSKNITDALEIDTRTIIIIDTWQQLFPSFKNVIDRLSEEAKANYETSVHVGLYCIPLNQIASLMKIEIPTSKIGKYYTLPYNDASWPNVQIEKSGEGLHYATGSQEQLHAFIKNYMDVVLKIEKNTTFTPKQQISLVDVLNSYVNESLNDPDIICKQFVDDFKKDTNGIIKFTQETPNVYICTYVEGTQVFDGITRDTRGYVVFFDYITNKFGTFRPTMPVTPDIRSDLSKDLHVLSLSKDSIDAFDIKSSKIDTILKEAPQLFKTSSKVHATVKVDGSLANILVITKHNPVFLIMIEIIKGCKLYPNSYYFNANKDMIIVIGSKSTLFARESVSKRIHNAILATYETMSLFIDAVQVYVNKLIENKTIDPTVSNVNLICEAVDAIPTSELTVKYGETFLTVLGCIYNAATTKIIFPNKEDFKCVVDVLEFNSFYDFKKYYDETYERLLNGDTSCHPEGFVIYVFDEETNTYYGIKVKFWFFYPGHNSTSTKNQALVHELRTNPKYNKLISRLFHLTELETPPLESILERDTIYPKLVEVCEALITLTDATNMQEGLNKKQWVELLNKNPKIIKDASVSFINMFALVSNYYPKYKEPPSESKVKAFFMTLHKELNLDINKSKILSLDKHIIQILINTYFN